MIGGLDVDERNEELFRQYDLKVYNIYRVKGAQFIETNEGLKLLQAFRGSIKHIELEQLVKKHLANAGYSQVDFYVKNKDGQYYVQDSFGDKYVLKNWFSGEESSFKEKESIRMTAFHLGYLHSLLKNVEFEEQIYFHNLYNLTETFSKHNRELKRVKSYIREKRQRNAFELCFLNAFDLFYEQGKQALQQLIHLEYEKIKQKALQEKQICHGNYTYHNLILTKSGIATTNFERCGIGFPVFDLYYFMRKVMEKNEWNIELGTMILKEYTKEYTPIAEEYKLLYILLLYPEKFWKVTNHYFNNKKSWVSQRDIQKICNIQEQNKKKEQFLKEIMFL